MQNKKLFLMRNVFENRIKVSVRAATKWDENIVL